MCQFAKLYPSEVVEQLMRADQELENPTLKNVLSVTETLNDYKFGQEALAQLQAANIESDIITQEALAQIEDVSKALAMVTTLLLLEGGVPAGGGGRFSRC